MRSAYAHKIKYFLPKMPIQLNKYTNLGWHFYLHLFGGDVVVPFFLTEIIKQLIFLIAYISNNNSFPKPLSAEEEKKALEAYAGGDYKAKDLLIERNLRLVAHVAKKYQSLKVDPDDIVSIGTIGLIKGITSFDMTKGSRLSTYVARCIDNAILFCVTHITLFMFPRERTTIICTL